MYMPHMCIYMHVKPIADREAQHLEIVPKEFQFSTRRTRILMGFIIYYLVLIVNPMGRILVRWNSIRNHLDLECCAPPYEQFAVFGYLYKYTFHIHPRTHKDIPPDMWSRTTLPNRPSAPPVLQCVAVNCSVLQCAAVCCSVLYRVAE